MNHTQFRDFEGERLYLQTVSKEDLMIHLVRYQFAMNEVQGVTLDVACGVGYGSFLLCSSTNVSKVFGCDVDLGAIDCAKEIFSSNKLTYQIEDGTNLSFKNNYFDSVVSLETVEHIPRVSEFFDEVSRVLKQDGTMVFSVPNRVFYSDAGWKNEFHYSEMNFQEFKEIAEKYFTEVTLYYQLMSPVDGLLLLRKYISRLLTEATFKRLKRIVNRWTLRQKIAKGMWKEYGIDFELSLIHI